METTLNNKFFDFEKAKVQTLTLDQLERTHKEMMFTAIRFEASIITHCSMKSSACARSKAIM